MRWGSNVTPRILGVRHRARPDPSQVIRGLVLDWCVSDVKSVQEDLGIETVRPLLRVHTATSEVWEERMVEESGILMDEAIAVKSSAYEEMMEAVEG